MTEPNGTDRRTRSGFAGAALLAGTVGVLALPSAVLAFSNKLDSLPTGPSLADGGFTPAKVDPRLARSITVRALSKDRTFRFTPAATPSRADAPVTVAVRVNAGSMASLAMRSRTPTEASPAQPGIAIAPGAYSLGAARGYRSFAQNTASVPVPQIRKMEMPDLAAYRPKGGPAADTSRFAPHIELDEKEKTGRSPRTFEQSDQSVGVGGAYRVTRNLDLTAGVRYTSDRDRLLPLTDGKQDSQAVYVGTQFRF